ERAAAARRRRDRRLVLRHGRALPLLRSEEAEGRQPHAGRPWGEGGRTGMRRMALSDRTPQSGMGDAAMARARSTEDVVVGDEIVRERLSARVVHWTVALNFFVCLFTGLPIWTPYLGFLASVFGGLHVCRWLHPWSGVAFAAASVLMFVQWVSQMKLTPADRQFITPRGMLRYFQYRNQEPAVRKYNARQKNL